MPTRQYVGARYVPKFANPIEWNNARAYEALEIVTYLGSSYTSKKAVPVGVEITNSEYWAVTGNYNAQVQEYRQEVEKLKEHKYIFISDSYEEYSHWIEHVVSKLNINSDDYYNIAVGGTCFSDGSWLTLITNWVNTHESEKNNITDIIIAGGLNDSNGSAGSGVLASSMVSFMNYVKANLPNAKVKLGFIGWALDSSPVLGGRDAGKRQATFGIYSRISEFGGIYLSGVECCLHDKSLIASDGVHPNELGAQFISEAVINAMFGCATVYKSAADVTCEVSGNTSQITGTVTCCLDKNCVYLYFNDLSFAGNYTIEQGVGIELCYFSIPYANKFPTFNVPVFCTDGTSAYLWNGRLYMNEGKLYIQFYDFENGTPVSMQNCLAISTIRYTLAYDAMYD